MASPAVGIATGITVVFGTSGFTSELLDINGPGMSREVIDISHQGTTGQRHFIGSDLWDPGEWTLSLHFNPDKDVLAIGGANEDMTITWPATGTWIHPCTIIGYTMTGVLDTKMTADLTVKVSRDIAIVAGS